MRYKFCFEDKRTRRATHDMILAMAKYGYRHQQHKFISDADVKRFFLSNGYFWDDLVDQCRKPRAIVPVIENLLGSTWRVSGGVKAAIVSDAATENEKEIVSVEGPGALTGSSYLQLFENAANNLDRCVESANFGDFQSCVSSGIASIDAYITHRALLYNSTHPYEILTDSSQNKVSQDIKIDEWIPKMTGDKKLDKSKANWQNFKRLRTVRDKLAIHVKQSAFCIGDQELCELLNLFSSGIAGLLIDLHLIFGEQIPCQIIRYSYLPDIRLVQVVK